MTTTPERTATLTSLVAAEIRAWMGRLDVRQSELARRVGETDQWMSMRLKGRTNRTFVERVEIMGAYEIQQRLGYSRSRTYQLVNRRDFPAPTWTLKMGQVWLADDVEAWIKANRPHLDEPDEA